VAGTGYGIWTTLEEATSLLKVETEILPDFKNKNNYNELFGIYKQAYPVLKSLFDSLSAIKSH
jgi:sugar (pentulose or hexulose) kinase